MQVWVVYLISDYEAKDEDTKRGGSIDGKAAAHQRKSKAMGKRELL